MEHILKESFKCPFSQEQIWIFFLLFFSPALLDTTSKITLWSDIKK